jgi:hypothetical protein
MKQISINCYAANHRFSSAMFSDRLANTKAYPTEGGVPAHLHGAIDPAPAGTVRPRNIKPRVLQPAMYGKMRSVGLQNCVCGDRCA